jgi:acyl-CoA synthetase (NDP forming)
LFGQAGIIATHSLGELVEASAFLAAQPLPTGRRVAIVSNAGGAGALAADACVENGLTVVTLSAATRELLTRLLPSRSAAFGPVDTTGAVAPDAFRACLEHVAADDGVDALVAIGVPTAVADLTDAIRTATVTKPMAAVLLDRPESVGMLAAADGAAAAAQWPRRIPVYGYPESAARALAHAVGYREWRDAPHGEVPELSDVDTAAARDLVSRFLAEQPEGGWLPADHAADLLACYGIPSPADRPAGSADAGVELAVEVVQQPIFGPLIVFGLGGLAADVLTERSARLAPLTDADADAMIGAVGAAAQLLGRAGWPAVAAVLLRVSRLADDVPELAALELNPLIARPDGVRQTAFRVRIAPAEPRDPFLRQLRGPAPQLDEAERARSRDFGP